MAVKTEAETESGVTEVFYVLIMVVVSKMKQWEGTFWRDWNVIYLDYGVYICQNS